MTDRAEMQAAKICTSVLGRDGILYKDFQDTLLAELNGAACTSKSLAANRVNALIQELGLLCKMLSSQISLPDLRIYSVSTCSSAELDLLSRRTDGSSHEEKEVVGRNGPHFLWEFPGWDGGPAKEDGLEERNPKSSCMSLSDFCL